MGRISYSMRFHAERGNSILESTLLLMVILQYLNSLSRRMGRTKVQSIID